VETPVSSVPYVYRDPTHRTYFRVYERLHAEGEVPQFDRVIWKHLCNPLKEVGAPHGDSQTLHFRIFLDLAVKVGDATGTSGRLADPIRLQE